MQVDAESLARIAGKHGFREAAVEKVLRLGEILSEINRHPLLGTSLVLKGGTPLNLCFVPPRRLSVDLDFNYVGAEDREVMLKQRPVVEGAIRRIANAAGYQVQESADEHAGRKLYFNYQNTAGVRDRVEVDVNFQHRILLVPARRLIMWQPEGYPMLQPLVVGLEELVAGKLCALLDRTAPRDLWDASRLEVIAAPVWGTVRFRAIFIALAGTLPHPVHSYTEARFGRITRAAVEEQLYPALVAGERPPADMLRYSAWATVAPLLQLTDLEREFTDRLQRGDLRPELLFPEDDEMVSRLARHPALRWKAQNARRQMTSKNCR